MNNSEPQKGSKLGFMTRDGFFQEIRTLNTTDLEYVSKSLEELKLMMDENLATENYEKCAAIRDELKKRAVIKN